MNKLLGILLILLYVTACTAKVSKVKNEKSTNSNTQNDCFCMEIYEPVCSGTKTYANKCKASCDGVKKVKNGACTIK